MSPFQAWWLAIRPKTLSLAASPVLLGNALALAEQDTLSGSVGLVTLAAALLIQIGTNLHNDAADHERGVDTADRLGPPRASAQGWLPARRVKQGATLAFALALLLGAYLVHSGGWPLILLGLASLTAGYGYTGGPRPIAYSASGELFVWLFFGLFAVSGSYYLQTAQLSLAALAGGAALGCLAAAVLTVNNYRDLDSDRQARRYTLCHWLERPGCRRLYGAFLLLPFPLTLALLPPIRWWALLPALGLAIRLRQRFRQTPPGPGLNRLLAATAGLQLLFALSLSTAILW